MINILIRLAAYVVFMTATLLVVLPTLWVFNIGEEHHVKVIAAICVVGAFFGYLSQTVASNIINKRDDNVI